MYRLIGIGVFEGISIGIGPLKNVRNSRSDTNYIT